jgi:hypothetical protein
LEQPAGLLFVYRQLPITNYKLPLQMNIDQNDLTDISSEEFEITLQQLIANPSVTQHFVRTITSGVDQIAAYYRLEFMPNQQRTILHIPIHPAMATLPEVQAIGIDDDLRIRVTDCQKYGVRIEAVLASLPVKSTTSLVEIIISSEILK